MIIFAEIKHTRSKEFVGIDGRPSETLRLRWNGPRPNIYWIVGPESLRLWGLGPKFFISSIEHYAVVRYKAASTLLMFSPDRVRAIIRSKGLSVPVDMLGPAYSELGTTFDPIASKTLITGLKSLGLNLLEFNWPDFLEHTHLCRAMGLQKSATLSIGERKLSSAVR